MTLADLQDIFSLYGQGLLIGLPLMGIFFLIGYVVNFLFDIIRRS